MPFLRFLSIVFAGAFALLADDNPFLEAEQSFLHQLNSMSGIELAGGPFQVGEQHHFHGESGYFILAPAIPIPTIDQRLSIQTRIIHTSPRTNSLPIASSPYETDLPTSDHRQIHSLLAQHGFALRRDEITILDTIQFRPVSHLPILKILPAESDPNSQRSAPQHCFVLLGAQSWHGIPLYRVSFDRIRGDFELDTLRENFVPRRRHELPLRPPILSSQTFFAEPGLAAADWTKLLRNFATIDLPALEILDATLSDRTVTLYADTAKPILPQQWVKLEKQNGQWQIIQAVEFRAEFPRPGAWWTFLPLLPESQTPTPDLFPDSDIPLHTRREITTLVQRLRGVGRITSLAANDNAIRVRTTHDHWRGYDLEFTRLQDTWRFTSVREWTD